MELSTILSRYLEQPKIELGDRSTYVGASDVGKCPRQAVLSKVIPETLDISTLIRFERGNLVENIVERALTHNGIPFVPQMEVKHPEEPYTAHLDFSFVRDTEIAVLETKSVSKIPDEPYPSWVSQLYFQIGLLSMYEKVPVRGGIFCVDLNTGEFKLFNGYSHNPLLFNGLLEKANHIWTALQQGSAAITEKSPLCSYCAYRDDCPEYDTDGLQELPVKAMAMDYQAAKQQEKQLKAEISIMRKDLEAAVKPYGEAMAGDYKLKLGTSTRNGFDAKRFKEDYPELAKEYQKTSTFTRLYVI